MKNMIFNNKNGKFDKAVDAFMDRHFYTAFCLLFIGIPVFILAAIFFCTTVIMLPISLLLGWI